MVRNLDENRNVTTENRGVNITSDTFPQPEENVQTDDFPSLHNVRNQLQDVIDVMGTATPHLVYSSSRGVDADNEESVISSTSIFSSVLQVKHVNKKDYSLSPYNSPRDVSENVQDSETYAMVNELPHEVQQPMQPLYMPAVLPPAILCMNPNCVCAHSAGTVNQIPFTTNYEDPKPRCKEKKHRFSLLMEKLTKPYNKNDEPAAVELYRMNIKQSKDDTSPPRRFVFDLVDGVPPKPEINTIGTNTKKCCQNKQEVRRSEVKVTKKPTCKNQCDKKMSSHYPGVTIVNSDEGIRNGYNNRVYYKQLEDKEKLKYKSDKETAKVDVYYFDHGNAAYYRTTDNQPVILTELLAEKAENYTTKFWAEFFGTLYIGASFITSFVLQFFRFLLHSILRPLTIGLLQIISDYFFKPFLATFFNAVVQPPLIFIYNIFTSIRDMCEPIAAGIGFFFKEIAILCKSCRLFEIRYDKTSTPPECCKKESI